MSTAHRSLAVGLALVLGGCSSVTGPQMAMTRAGPVDKTADSGPAAVFIRREAAARAAPAAQAHQTSLLMLTSGMSLAQANCRGYFASAGRNQRNVIVARQVVNAVGALAVTLMLLDDVDPDSITLVELGQSTANTGLDIWTQNYLFAAENISTVEELVIKAEDAYSAVALSRTNLDYEKATDLLMGYQAICAPRRVAALVLEAVKAGNVTPAPTNAGAASLEVVRDREARRKLADVFGVPGELNDQQIGALWWLLMSYSTTETRSGQIATALGRLADVVLDNGEVKSGWTKVGEVRQALMLLPSDTQQTLAKTATDTQKAEDDRAKLVKDAADKAAAAVAATQNATPPAIGPAPGSLSPVQRNQFLSLLGNDQTLIAKLNGPFSPADLAALRAAIPPTLPPPVAPAVFSVPRPAGNDNGAIVLNVH